MKIVIRAVECCGVVVLGLALAWSCGFDNTLREYLNAQFWLPFAKWPASFERPNVRRISAPFAGMDASEGKTTLTKLRMAYRAIAEPTTASFDAPTERQLVAVARADQSLTQREREEVDLIDAKIDMRAAGADGVQQFESAKKKLQAFIRTAQTPEYVSEARGWLARVYYLLGDQTAAGKIYLDELNRNGSNLSRETLLNSLKITYGYDGGPQLLARLEEYFDTPEHAAFAIQMVTNPRWNRWNDDPSLRDNSQPPDARIKSLLEKHSDLLRTSNGANALALLAMRTALHVGDPNAARKLAGEVPSTATVRSEPDFQWMLASALYLSGNHAAAEKPLRALFESARADENQRAAAAYGLCGVYFKTGNVMERIRYALWLHTVVRKKNMYLSYASQIEDLTVYWAISGWDLKLLLDAETPTESLRAFVTQHPNVEDIRLVKYSLAVRLARENKYEESADIYTAIHAVRRAPRMRRLATLYREATRSDLAATQILEAKYQLAKFLHENSVGVYFNDALWSGLQNYALKAPEDVRLTRAERERLISLERKLRDDQEEHWRAYLILRDVVREAGHTALGHKAAKLALRCLSHISTRFERAEEIQAAQTNLWRWLRNSKAHANSL